MPSEEKKDERKLYPYRCLLHPPGPGAMPKGDLAYCITKEGETPEGHHFWGTVVYTRELTPEEIDQYDLEKTEFETETKRRRRR